MGTDSVNPGTYAHQVINTECNRETYGICSLLILDVTNIEKKREL